jgi:hypothetical protein
MYDDQIPGHPLYGRLSIYRLINTNAIAAMIRYINSGLILDFISASIVQNELQGTRLLPVCSRF